MNRPALAVTSLPHRSIHAVAAPRRDRRDMRRPRPSRCKIFPQTTPGKTIDLRALQGSPLIKPLTLIQYIDWA